MHSGIPVDEEAKTFQLSFEVTDAEAPSILAFGRKEGTQSLSLSFL